MDSLRHLKISDFDNICRLCLQKKVSFRQLFKTDAKRSQRNSVLASIKMLIDSEINSNDGLPKQICEVCHISLTRFGVFQRRSIKSVGTLKTILKAHEGDVKLEVDDRLSSPSSDFASDNGSGLDIDGKKPLKPEEIGDHDLKFGHVDLMLGGTVDHSTDNNKDVDLELVKIEPNNCEGEPSGEIIVPKPKRRRRQVTKNSIPIIDDGDDEQIDNNNKNNDADFKVPHIKRRRRCKQRDVEPTIDDVEKNRKPRGKYRIKTRIIRIQTDLELFPEKDNSKDDKPCGKDGKEKKMCPLCGELYHNISIHLLTHNPEKNFPCAECGKAFKTSGTLKTHTESIHLQIRQFKCSVCHALFKTKVHLKMHRAIHTGEQKFECNICGRSLSAASSYRYHMLTHTQERNHECPQCHEKFISKQRLHHHMPKHTGEKIFQCGICTERFRYSSAATQHRRRHMNANHAYVCTFCQTEFRDMRLFTIHHQAIHNVKLPLVKKNGTDTEQDESAQSVS